MTKYRLYSVGHSNQSQEDFLELLKSHDVNCIVDVRSMPAAKTAMCFDSQAFREEHADLYACYCKPRTREATIVIKRNKNPQE